MKTAMQEFLDYMKEYNIILVKEGIEPNLLIKMLQHKAEKLLEQEKNQINVSFISGAIEALSSYTPVRDRIKDGYFEDKAEQYFNYLYNQN